VNIGNRIWNLNLKKALIGALIFGKFIIQSTP